jgi:hypothetical protein
MKTLKHLWSSTSLNILNRPATLPWLLAALLTALPAVGGAADNPSGNPEAPPALPRQTNVLAKAEKPPPLPLHQIEGNRGIFSTMSAYLVNPPRNGEPVGRPGLGFAYINVGHGRNLEAFTLTETPWKRLELGYAYDRFDLGDLPQDIERATTVRLRNDNVGLHNLNARLQLLKEGEFNQKWLPALTFGSHYKYNDGVKRINDDLGGALRGIGIQDNDGMDFTLYASKLLTFLPRPVLLNAGGRATKGAHIGLLGFTDDYNFVVEGSAVVFITDRLLLGAEYRQKPNAYKTIPGLVGREDDWWTIDAAYVVSKHCTIAAGYGHFGRVLNHDANGVWGITTKWEF